MELAQALGDFLLALEARGCRPATVKSYRMRLAGLVSFLLARGIGDLSAKAQAGLSAVSAQVDLGTVGPGDLDSWVVSLRRQSARWVDHPARPEQAGGLSPATISGRVQSAKALFDWCVRREYLEKSPASHLRKPKVNHHCDGSKVMAVEDLARLVAVAEKRADAGKPRDLALLLFLVETGCRVGEAASLRLDWLDLEKGDGVVEGKTDRRAVDFTEVTAEALRAWLAVRPVVGHVFVWVGQRGGPLSARGIYEVLRRLAKEAGVEGRFNPHAIRHLVGQSWSDAVNLELVRQKLGHSDIRVTAMFYSNQDRGRVKAATQKLSLVNGRQVEK